MTDEEKKKQIPTDPNTGEYTGQDGVVVTPNGRPQPQPVNVMPPAPLSPKEQEYEQIAKENGVVTPEQQNWAQQQMQAEQNQQQSQISGQQTQQPQGYQPLEDWGSGKSFAEIAKGSKHSIGSLIADRNKWAKENGKDPLDFWEYGQLFMDNDPSKSIEENEKEKKRKQWEDAFAHLGNVMMTFGNFVGAIGGAPSPSTPIDPHKLTKSQLRRREAANQQRQAYNKYLLEQMYKQKAEERAREKNLAEIGLIQERVRASQEKDKRDQALAESTIKNRDANTELIGERKNTEKARQAASYASAAASRARANATNKAAYGTDYRNSRHKIFAANKRKYPEDIKTFMDDNNIHGYDKKNWTPELIDQFNAEVADKYANQGSQSSTGKTLGLGIGQ